MSYYWKKKGSIYHWHLQCSLVPVHVRTDPNWEISEQKPVEREKCRECREKDIAEKIKTKL